MHSDKRHILVVRFSAMGDVAMLSPVIRTVIDQNPGIRLTVLTRSFFKPLFRDIERVEVLEADLKGKHQGIPGLWKLSRQIKKLGVSSVADCHNVLRTRLISLFLPAIKLKRIDKGRREKKKLVSGQIFEQLKPTVERYADVFRELGCRVDLGQATFPAPYKIPEILKGNLDIQKPIIGIAPFAAFEGKSYPIEKMTSVVTELALHHNILLFGGGQKETEILDKIASDSENVHNVAGSFTFPEELDLISNLDLMIAMDSGNAHLSAMFGIPTITIWGVTHPFAGFYPFKQNMDLALLADRKSFPKIPTSVYGKDMPAGYNEAMQTIKPEAIIHKALSVLKDQTSS